MSPTTRSAGSVSVPVLSVQTMSTEASDSTAFSCCASTPRCATLNADTAAVRLIEQDQPLGHEVDDPGRQRLNPRRAAVDAEQHGDGERGGERDREPEQPQQQPVVGPLERRARMAERSRGLRQPRGAALRPDRRHLEERRALDRERARPDRLARAAHDRLRLARQVRLVEREPVRRHHGRRRRRPGRRPRGGRDRPRRPRRPARGGRPRRARPSPPGATSAASRSSARLERISWNDPIATFATRMPMKSASFHEANASVSTPNANRIPLGTFTVFATTMLAYERLERWRGSGRAPRGAARPRPRSAR